MQRLEELCDALDENIQCGKLKRSEGERLRGRLQFACGQLFGRTARNHIRVLSAREQSVPSVVGTCTKPIKPSGLLVQRSSDRVERYPRHPCRCPRSVEQSCP